MRVPGVKFVQGRNDYTDADGFKYGIAIHNTSNDASDENEASYATRRTDGVSAHFYVDVNSITQSIDTNDRCGHAGSRTGNENSIAVEITGANNKSRDWWLKNVAWDKLAATLAYVIKNDPDFKGFQIRRASVDEMKKNPKVKAFYGHDDMRRAWGGTTHTDPGPNFPWDHLIKVVKTAVAGKVDDDMEQTDKLRYKTGFPDRVIGQTLADVHNVRDWGHNPVGWKGQVNGPLPGSPLRLLEQMVVQWPALVAQVTALSGRDPLDEQAVVDGVLAGLGGKAIDDAANALQAAFGDRTAELANRLLALASGVEPTT